MAIVVCAGAPETKGRVNSVTVPQAPLASFDVHRFPLASNAMPVTALVQPGPAVVTTQPSLPV